jgi:hypothetical protein
VSIVGGVAGNFYFHPQVFTGNGTGPNTYLSGDNLLLWGNNWQNTEANVDWTGVPLPSNPIAAATRAAAVEALGNNSQPLGIDIGGPIVPGGGGGIVPEPVSVLFWGLGMATCAMVFGRSRKNS